MPGAREAALKALGRFRRQGGKLDELLRAALEPLDGRDAALATRLCFGVVQTAELLELGLSAHVNLKKAPPQVVDILYTGAYQLWFMDKIPRHALVDESVRLTRSCAPYAAGMVNAVLRKLPEQPPMTENPCVRHSIPPWMYGRIRDVLGTEGAEAFFTASDEIPPITVHINPLKPTREIRGAEPHPFLPGCVLLTGGIDRLESFTQGEFLVADGASRLCVMALGASPGTRVWDVCAAPGGKSALLAFAMRNEGTILATDFAEKKLPLIGQTMARLGVSIVHTAAGDGRAFRPDEPFDAVLCDVPCSGLGVLRKKPDIRGKKPDEIARLPAVQRDILSHAALFVKPGGTLVYSTCTVLPEENEDVVSAFLTQNSDFEPESFSLQGVGECSGGMVTLWPHIHGTDGFFIAKMRRKNVPGG